jgi:Family of unknown function (DUF6261)
MLFTVNSFYNLRNPEFLQQGKDLQQVILDANPSKLEIEKRYLPFAADMRAIEVVFKQAKASPLTQILVDSDDKRDNIVAAANLLSDSIDVFGRGLIRFNYQSESANMSNLIDNWEKDANLSAALVLLHLDDWKNELKATNNFFIKTYTDRAKEEGATATILNIKELREKAMFSWGKLQNLIIGKIEEYEDDAVKTPLYTALANNINAVLDNYNTLLAQREGRKLAKAAKKKAIE